jgi:hypothetical protein
MLHLGKEFNKVSDEHTASTFFLLPLGFIKQVPEKPLKICTTEHGVAFVKVVGLFSVGIAEINTKS